MLAGLSSKTNKSKQSFDIRFNFFGFNRRRVAFDRFTFSIDQKFGEVPLDLTGPENSSLSCREELKQRMRIRAVHVDFGEEREFNPKIHFAKRLNLGFSARL